MNYQYNINEIKNTIINGDAIQELEKIPDNSIDMVITDPPYYTGFNSTVKSSRSDVGGLSVLKLFFDKIFKEYTRILKTHGRIFMFTDWRTYSTLYLCAIKYIKIANMIVWDYGWIKAGNQYRFTHELIVHAIMPDATSPKDRSISDVWRFKPVNFSVERLHQAQKPVKIIDHMIEQTAEKGYIILDSFAGSGTTLVSCKKNGVNYIGIELNSKYVDIAKDRLENTEILNIFDDNIKVGLDKFEF